MRWAGYAGIRTCSIKWEFVRLFVRVRVFKFGVSMCNLVRYKLLSHKNDS